MASPKVQQSPEYAANKAHRNGTSGKSQWKISEASEVACFDISATSGWLQAEYGWGVHKPNGKCEYLGLDRDHKTEVFIAQFEAKSVPAVWHGYPVNYQRDRAIPEDVLSKWLAQKVLPAAKIAKITRRKRCSL